MSKGGPPVSSNYADAPPEYRQDEAGAPPPPPNAVSPVLGQPVGQPMMSVQVPHGVLPGQAFLIQTPSGQQQQVVCPNGAGPGSMLQVPMGQQRGQPQGVMVQQPTIGPLTVCFCVCFFPVGILALFCPCDQKQVMVDPATGQEMHR
jgi:hypothetical protein